jgi:anti-anti-sigma factor
MQLKNGILGVVSEWPPYPLKEGIMSVMQAPIWKGSALTIERQAGKAPGTSIFRFAGPFTARDMFASLSPEAMRNLFESESNEKQTLAIFDLTRVPYMDSIGLGMMVSQHVRCLGKGIRMVAVGVNPRVLKLLKLTKLDSFIPTAATVEEAEAQ